MEERRQEKASRARGASEGDMLDCVRTVTFRGFEGI